MGSPRGQCPLGCCAPRCGWARAHTQLRTARACYRPVGGWRAASWRAQLALGLRMAPAAAANEQTARARVRLRGSAERRRSAAGRVAQQRSRRRCAGGARGRAGWGAAVRVGACGKPADRAVSGGKRANGRRARRAARQQQQRGGRCAGACARASKRERRAGDARVRTGSSSAVRASSCGKQAGAGLGWAGSGACSSGGGSEGGDFSGVAIGRQKGGGTEEAGSQGRTRARAGAGRVPMVRGVGGGVAGLQRARLTRDARASQAAMHCPGALNAPEEPEGEVEVPLSALWRS